MEDQIFEELGDSCITTIETCYKKNSCYRRQAVTILSLAQITT